jgi:hypothetical protein
MRRLILGFVFSGAFSQWTHVIPFKPLNHTSDKLEVLMAFSIKKLLFQLHEELV